MNPYSLAQRHSTQNQNIKDMFRQGLYDRVCIDKTVLSSYNLFSLPVGQTATLIRGTSSTTSAAKTRRDTNLSIAGTVSSESYEITGISMAMYHQVPSTYTNGNDRDLIMRSGYIIWKIGAKEILVSPLGAFKPNNPLGIASTGVTTITILNESTPANGPFKLFTKVTLNPQESIDFTLNMDLGAGLALSYAVDVQFTFDSTMFRPT